MRKFIYKVLLFLACFICMDIFYGVIMNIVRRDFCGGSISEIRYVCDSVKADILIFGSSRARMQYDPVIISDYLNMSCYNCGQNGMGIISDYTKMKIVSQRYMPKMVIIDILPILDLMRRDDNIIFVNDLRPWYYISGVDSVFWKIDPNERIKMFSNTYRYHSKLLEYIMSRNTPMATMGYAPADASKIIRGKDLLQSEPTDNVPDSLKLYYLERFFTEYKNKTKIVVIVSPRYMFKKSNTVEPLRALCKKYEILLLDHYSDSNLNRTRKDFVDGNHMNIIGATKWSKFIAKEIKCKI